MSIVVFPHSVNTVTPSPPSGASPIIAPDPFTDTANEAIEMVIIRELDSEPKMY